MSQAGNDARRLREGPGSEGIGPWRRVLLVGFMGSGKSAVGRALSRELGWPFYDFDREVERSAGAPIPRIFRERGEAAFRAMEARIGEELLARDLVVLASGGGWPCAPGRMERAGPAGGTLTIWLRVDPETAVARMRGGRRERPLLDVPDPVARARELLQARRPHYEKAHWSVDGETAPPGILAARLARRLRTDPERPLRE